MPLEIVATMPLTHAEVEIIVGRRAKMAGDDVIASLGIVVPALPMKLRTIADRATNGDVIRAIDLLCDLIDGPGEQARYALERIRRTVLG